MSMIHIVLVHFRICIHNYVEQMNWYSIISLTSEVYRLGDNQVCKDRNTRSAIVSAEGRACAPRAHAAGTGTMHCRGNDSLPSC